MLRLCRHAAAHSLVTGGASTVLYTVGGAPFDAMKLASVLWILTVASKFKDSDYNEDELKKEPVEKFITVATTVLAFAP